MNIKSFVLKKRLFSLKIFFKTFYAEKLIGRAVQKTVERGEGFENAGAMLQKIASRNLLVGRFVCGEKTFVFEQLDGRVVGGVIAGIFFQLFAFYFAEIFFEIPLVEDAFELLEVVGDFLPDCL